MVALVRHRASGPPSSYAGTLYRRMDAQLDEAARLGHDPASLRRFLLERLVEARRPRA